MAKLRGEHRYKHRFNIESELWALERELDSLAQRGFPVSRQLGRVRSVILRIGADDQKTLKRWMKPAPNHARAQALLEVGNKRAQEISK